MTATTDSVIALRERVEALHLEAEATALADMLRQREYSAQLIEEWGDFIDPLDSFRSEADFFGGVGGGTFSGGRQDRADDRRHGDFAPHFTSEQELSRIRGICAYLAETDVTILGAFETLTAYILKDGFTHSTTALAPEAETLAAQVKEVIDEFTDRVHWYGGVDKESLLRTRKHGTRFMRVRDCPYMGAGYASVEFYEPSWITEPQNSKDIAAYYGLPEGLDWKYGVVTDPLNVSIVWGFFAARFGDPYCAEFVPASEMSCRKVNVDSNVKLGLPDLYAGRKWFQKADKVFERTLDGTAIQSSIALTREYPNATRNSLIQGAADGKVDYTASLPRVGGGTKSVAMQQFRSGEIVDQKGVNVRYGAIGEGHGETFMAVGQGALRVASRRWGFTEDVIAGDASNNAYSSLMEATSPVLIRMKAAQADVGADDVQVLWMVVDKAVDGGRIEGVSKDQLRQLVKITAKPPDIEHHDRLEETEIRQIEHTAGVLSLRTWCEEAGREYDEERQNIAEEPQPIPPAIGVRFDGPGAPQLPGMPAAAAVQKQPTAQQAAMSEAILECRTLQEARAIAGAVVPLVEADARWVTLDNGVHVKIDSKGNIDLPRGGKVDELARAKRDALVKKAIDKGWTKKVQKAKAAQEGIDWQDFDKEYRHQQSARNPKGQNAPMTDAQKAQAAVDRAAQAKAEQDREVRTRQAIEAGKETIDGAKLSPAERIEAHDFISQSESPREAASYAAAVASWKTSRPERAAIDSAVAALKAKGIRMEQRGDNYSWYGKTKDGRTVRVGDHLGKEAHDIDIVFEMNRLPTKEKAAGYIKSELEGI